MNQNKTLLALTGLLLIVVSISNGCIGGRDNTNPRIPDRSDTRNTGHWRIPGDAGKKKRITSEVAENLWW